MTQKPAIEVRGVRKVYGAKVPVEALKGVDLTIAAGEFVALIGASGSGKSTLMHILGCLQRPSQGELVIDGVNAAELSAAALAAIRGKKIGFVFQQFNLLPRRTAQQNVALPLSFQGVSRGERRKRAVELLGKVGLGDRMDHTPAQLSGGEQQRVAIARALIGNPAIILADEPTGNLDTRSSAEIMSILKSLNDEGRTVIIVTHEPDIANWTRRIIRLRDGKVIEDYLK